MLAFHAFLTALRKLELEPSQPVVVHTSLSAFGEVQGGAQTVLGALTSFFDTLIMPSFTYKTMLIPEKGPADNAIIYGSGKDTNRMAEIYHPGMPSDRMMGVVAEALRQHPSAHRSAHPILSFTGLNADPLLDAQTSQHPLLFLQKLVDRHGWVLLMGVDHTVNTSIHYAEHLAGRKQFTRWALTPNGVVTCPEFPGCSSGFEAIAPHLDGVVRKVELAEALIQAVPLVNLVDAVCALLQEDPLALLCARPDCPRCNAVRAWVADQPTASIAQKE